MIKGKTICRNYLHTKSFILVIGLKNQIFSLFLIVKMNANYAETFRVGNLEADFQQVTLVQFFSEIFTILLGNINNSNSAKKSKKHFLLDKNSKQKISLL